jgi:hypothetical protein
MPTIQAQTHVHCRGAFLLEDLQRAWDLHSGGALAEPLIELVPICKTDDGGVGGHDIDESPVCTRVLLVMMLAKVGCPFLQNKR